MYLILQGDQSTWQGKSKGLLDRLQLFSDIRWITLSQLESSSLNQRSFQKGRLYKESILQEGEFKEPRGANCRLTHSRERADPTTHSHKAGGENKNGPFQEAQGQILPSVSARQKPQKPQKLMTYHQRSHHTKESKEGAVTSPSL